MYLDLVLTTPDEFAVVDERTGRFSDPPDGLLAALAWEENGGAVRMLMVWETPAHRGDFGFQHMMPLMESGEVTSTPEVLRPLKTFVRGA